MAAGPPRSRVSRWPIRDDGFRWRVSIADIETDGPFSAFPGVDRDLLLLAGKGIELDINDAAPLRLDQRFQRVHFGGEDKVGCRLLAGPTRDFNVMAQRGVVSAEVHARPLNGTMLVFVEPGDTWLIHVFAGQADGRGGEQTVSAESGATLLVESGTERVANASSSKVAENLCWSDSQSLLKPGCQRTICSILKCLPQRFS